MPESNEQGLVERLLAGAKPEPKIDTTLFVSEERQREMLFRVTLPFAGPDDIADAIREAIEETVRTIQRHTRDHAEAQSVQIAELQASKNLYAEAEIKAHAQLVTAEAQIADLKRALDTARTMLVRASAVMNDAGSTLNRDNMDALLIVSGEIEAHLQTKDQSHGA